MENKLKSQIKSLIILFVVGLVLSGLTAFPIEMQLRLAHELIITFNWDNVMTDWLELIYKGVKETNSKYPFLSYGTDWLAFAHLVIAIAFIGPLYNPSKNIWVIEFGMIACAAIFPMAMIAGAIRGIPVYWRLIDCSFGFFGGSLLWVIHHKIKRLIKLSV